MSSLSAAMSSPSVPDSDSCATPKGQSLTEQQSLSGDKCASHLNPSDQDGGSWKPGKRRGKSRSLRKRKRKHRAMQLSSPRRKEEVEEEDIEPTRLQKRKVESRFPIGDDYHMRSTDQTWPSQYRGRPIPSHSSEPVISNAPRPPFTSGSTSVVQSSPSVPGQTPLPKPDQVSPLQPPHKTSHENCKDDYHRPPMLEQHKNDRKHQKKRRICEELVQMPDTKNGKQSVSQLNLTDHPKKVQKSEKYGCSTQNIASGFVADKHKREMQLQINVENISEVPAEAPEGRTMEKEGGKCMGTSDGSKQPTNTASVRSDLCDVKCESQFVHQSHVTGKNHLSKLRHTRDNPTMCAQVQQGDNNPQVLSKPAETLFIRCELCDVKCESHVTYKEHVNGRKHLYRLTRARAQHVFHGAGQEVGSEGLLGLQTPYPPKIKAQSNANNAHNPLVLSKTVELSNGARAVSLKCDVCNVKYVTEFAYRRHMKGRTHLRTLKLSRDDRILFRKGKQAMSGKSLGRQRLHPPDIKDHILFRKGKQAVSGKPLGLQRLHPPDINDHSLFKKGKQVVSGEPLGLQRLHLPYINAQLKANSARCLQGDNNGVLSRPVKLSERVKVFPSRCDICHIKHMSIADYQSHMSEETHLRRLERVHKMVDSCMKTINDQVQRGDGNSLLFAELMATVLSKTHVLARAPETCTMAANIPASTSMAGPSCKPQLLQTQVSEIQEHVEIEDSSGITKTDRSVDAEILVAPTSMAGPSYEAQLLQTQGYEVKTDVEMENPSGKTKTELVVAAEISAPTSMSGPSYEPQLLQMQVSEIKAHVGIENPCGEIKTELAVTAEVPAPTSIAGLSYEPQLLQTQVSESKAHVEIENLSGEPKTVACPTEVKS